MSRFLKFIVHLVVICLILCVVALVVPPFLGVTTEIQDGDTQGTNLPMGSVTYAIPVKSAEVRIGDPILVTEDSTVYRYNLASIDLDNGRGTVIDPAVTNAEPVTVAIRDYVPKIVLEVPFLGYLMMATESVEGLVILGLVALFLIVLYVIAELWRHSPEADNSAYYEDIEASRAKQKRQSAKENSRRNKEMQPQQKKRKARNEGNAEAGLADIDEGKERRRQVKSGGGRIRTGGFVDEVDESDFENYSDYDGFDEEEEVVNATNEAHALLRQEIAAATGGRNQGNRQPASGSRPSAQMRNDYAGAEKRQSRVVRENAGPQRTSAAAQSRPADEIPAAETRAARQADEGGRGKLAIPRYSVDELARNAEAEGDDVEMLKDDVTEVTLFDYSDMFANFDSNFEDE